MSHQFSITSSSQLTFFLFFYLVQRCIEKSLMNVLLMCFTKQDFVLLGKIHIVFPSRPQEILNGEEKIIRNDFFSGSL
jgi:hypothetical protein